MLALTHSLATSVAVPITGPWPQAFPAKDLCSNCGLCRSTVGVASVTEACAFIGDGMSRAESLEAQVHGRARRYDAENLDEAHFGVHEEIVLARAFLPNSQWTGVATSVATEPTLGCAALVKEAGLRGACTYGLCCAGADSCIWHRWRRQWR